MASITAALYLWPQRMRYQNVRPVCDSSNAWETRWAVLIQGFFSRDGSGFASRLAAISHTQDGEQVVIDG